MSDQDGAEDPRRYQVPASRRNETIAAVLLIVAGVGLLLFGVLLALGANTQLLGISAGGALVALAAGLILLGNGVMPQETSVEERIQGDTPEETAALEDDLVHKPLEGVSRRKLLGAAAGVTATGAAAAAAVPITSLGPSPKTLTRSPWRAGLRLVTEEEEPLRASALQIGSFITAFPERYDMRALGSSLVVVRVDPRSLDLPPERDGWAPEGILAFSKICTHAACAVSLFRHPVVESLSSGPALVCPCHYSTFDVRRGAQVIFGPAGRPLPQLPLAIDADGVLVSTGRLSGSPGPAWWATRRGDL